MRANKLPKYWAVYNDDSQRFKDIVIKYMNDTYNSKWVGTLCNEYYGYDGNLNNGGTNAFTSLSNFRNKDKIKELSIDEFISRISRIEGNISKEYKPGDIVVMTKKYGKLLVGDMYQVIDVLVGDRIYLNSGIPQNKRPSLGKVRKATEAEARAYQTGAKHIDAPIPPSGKPNQGDVVVSLKKVSPWRNKGDIFRTPQIVPSKGSTNSMDMIYYLSDRKGDLNTFRVATLEEVRLLDAGITNIYDVEHSSVSRLPQYWIVQCDGSIRFHTTVMKYIESIIPGWGGSGMKGYWYGYDGNTTHKGINYYSEPTSFRNNPIQLSLDDWIRLSGHRRSTYIAGTDLVSDAPFDDVKRYAGLSVGDKLSYEDINAWIFNGKNEWQRCGTSWELGTSEWSADKVIKSFEEKDGVMGMVFEQQRGYYTRADGYLDFLTARNSPKNTVSDPRSCHGLRIGMEVSKDIINDWAHKNHEYSSQHPEWRSPMRSWGSARTLEGFTVKDGIDAVAISGPGGFYLKAEGFLDFINSYKTASEELSSYAGLNVGDVLPEGTITKWCKEGYYYYGGKKRWERGTAGFVNDRKILSFQKKDGVMGFEVSGTLSVFLKADGFKAFYEGESRSTVVEDISRLVAEEPTPWRTWSAGSVPTYIRETPMWLSENPHKSIAKPTKLKRIAVKER